MTSRRRSNWVVTAWLVAVGLGYLYFLFVPNRRHIQHLRQTLSEKRIHVARNSGLRDAIAATQQSLEQTEAFVARWRKTAPRTEELSPIHAEINLRAAAAGTKLDSFDPQSIINYAWLRKVPMRLTVHGSFEEVHQLLRGLEELPGTLWVENLKLEGGQVPGSPLQAELNLAIFADNPGISD